MNRLLEVKQMEFIDRRNRSIINEFIAKQHNEYIDESTIRDNLRDFLLSLFSYDETMFYFKMATK